MASRCLKGKMNYRNWLVVANPKAKTTSCAACCWIMKQAEALQSHGAKPAQRVKPA